MSVTGGPKRLTAKVRAMLEANGVFEVNFSNTISQICWHALSSDLFSFCLINRAPEHLACDLYAQGVPGGVAGVCDRQQYASDDQAQPGPAVAGSEASSPRKYGSDPGHGSLHYG
jgi:hypothetical protein